MHSCCLPAVNCRPRLTCSRQQYQKYSIRQPSSVPIQYALCTITNEFSLFTAIFFRHAAASKVLYNLFTEHHHTLRSTRLLWHRGHNCGSDLQWRRRVVSTRLSASLAWQWLALVLTSVYSLNLCIAVVIVLPSMMLTKIYPYLCNNDK